MEKACTSASVLIPIFENVKVLVGTFNQEKALVGAFSVIVKTICETDGWFYTTRRWSWEEGGTISGQHCLGVWSDGNIGVVLGWRRE